MNVKASLKMNHSIISQADDDRDILVMHARLPKKKSRDGLGVD